MEKYASNKTGIKERILKAVTVTASAMTGCDKIGNIKPGVFADFFVLRAGKAVEGSINTALDTFFNASDSNVELVMLGGNPVYGDIKCISRFTGGTQFYATLPTSNVGLRNKRVYIPEHFRTADFSVLYSEYIHRVRNAGLELSLVRSGDDEKYSAIINELQRSYPGVMKKQIHLGTLGVWFDTGIDVYGAVKIKSEAENGNTEANSRLLSAKIGRDGTPVALLRSESFFIGQKGRLYLSINNNSGGNEDSSRGFSVIITAEGKQSD